MNKIKDLHTIDEWSALLNSVTNNHELLIFKKSPRCSISLWVERGFDQWVQTVDTNQLIIAKINVVSNRPLSQHIAKELGVHHESPQAIWLDRTKSVKWQGSHYDIDDAALNEHFNSSQSELTCS